MITRNGKEQVVVLSVEQFAQLTKRVRQPKSLVRFFAESPLLANAAKHAAFTRCGELNLYGIVNAQLAVVEGELLAANLY